MALIVVTITGDQSVWSWAAPVGLAGGLAFKIAAVFGLANEVIFEPE